MTTTHPNAQASSSRLRKLTSVAILAVGFSALGQAAIASAQPSDPNFDPRNDPELSCVAGGGSWDITESDEIGSIDGGGGCVGGGELDEVDEPPVPPVPPVGPPTGDPSRPPLTGQWVPSVKATR